MSAAAPLQAVIFARLTGDAALTALIGMDGVHDRLLTRNDAPYVLIAGIESQDYSTASERGEVHLMRIEARSGEGGGKAVQIIAARVTALLHDADLPLTGFALVSLLHRQTVTERDAKAKGHVARMQFRAVTE